VINEFFKRDFKGNGEFFNEFFKRDFKGNGELSICVFCYKNTTKSNYIIPLNCFKTELFPANLKKKNQNIDEGVFEV